MNEEEKQWVLNNVDNINADTHDIDELCCALEHSTIFAIDYIQTFATKLIDFELKYKTLQQELDQYKNNWEELKTYLNMVIGMNFNMNNDKLSEQTVDDYTNILNKMKELEEDK